MTLSRETLTGATLDAARALLGANLVREAPSGDPVERRVGRIVEVEAYIGEDDRASHARFGRTARNAVMYGPPGVAYVYLVYGMYECLNVVTEPAGRPAAVLIRAVAPVSGEAALRAARFVHALRRARTDEGRARAAARIGAIPAARLASGPGLVGAAFDITRDDTGRDLLDRASPLRLEPGSPPTRVVATPRIGIDYAPEPWRSTHWRFVEAR
ncbi:MAG TPA: DNA-3-methyladenine glycosylase [Candidatus Dormibacteraeota bacterium]|nr:DNA-3-methyladenine glycosylase [Candidatus Dormibacteraeota bacterium]